MAYQEFISSHDMSESHEHFIPRATITHSSNEAPIAASRGLRNQELALVIVLVCE